MASLSNVDDVLKSRTCSVTAIVLIVFIAALPYVNTLNGGIVYDDKVAVVGNPDVTIHGLPVLDLFIHDFWGNCMNISLPSWLGINVTIPTSPWSHNSWRPLTVLTLRANHAFAGQQTPLYHITNIVIHVFACLSAYYAVSTLLGRARWFQACVASVLFAAAPVHTEVVANITSRAETLCAVPALLAIAIYFHCTNGRARGVRTSPGFLSSFIAVTAALTLVIIAVMCKETALVILAMIAALDIVVNTPESTVEPSEYCIVNFCRYVKHVLINGPWPRFITLLALQALLLYVRVTVLSSG